MPVRARPFRREIGRGERPGDYSEEGREEAVSTVIVYAPLVAAIIFMVIVYGYLKSKAKR